MRTHYYITWCEALQLYNCILVGYIMADNRMSKDHELRKLEKETKVGI